MMFDVRNIYLCVATINDDGHVSSVNIAVEVPLFFFFFFCSSLHELRPVSYTKSS